MLNLQNSSPNLALQCYLKFILLLLYIQHSIQACFLTFLNQLMDQKSQNFKKNLNNFKENSRFCKICLSLSQKYMPSCKISSAILFELNKNASFVICTLSPWCIQSQIVLTFPLICQFFSKTQGKNSKLDFSLKLVLEEVFST